MTTLPEIRAVHARSLTYATEGGWCAAYAQDVGVLLGEVDRLALVVAELESAIVEAEDRGIAAGAREALATVTPSLLGCPVGWRESAQSIAARAKGTLRVARSTDPVVPLPFAASSTSAIVDGGKA